uniref:B30.2/SPRY domain-containing protein n=1 Tax=Globodera pallida TaxID=36090 RepID=A0A183CD75_GLOPA
MPLAKEIGFEGYAYQSCGTFLNHEAPGCYYSDMDDKPRALFEEGIEGIRPGNVVGCGVDFKNKKIFYTLNGERLGPAGEFVDSSVRLFPCVSLARDGDEIEANFGPDFEFKTLLKWDEIVNKNLLPKD